jgi:DNA-binding LytR/AlgR family response regulator
MKTLARPPQVIFTTAYKEFAHEAFDLATGDYLLKPFSLERFIVAVDKAREKLESNNKPLEESLTESYTYIKSDGKIYKLNFDQVCFAEADGNNVKNVTDSGLIKPAITFAAQEELLPKATFIRLHRSFLINKNKIGHIDGNRVFIGSTQIPIGASYREFFFRAVGLK